jgi:hypothetical protein
VVGPIVDHQVSTDFTDFLVMHAEIYDPDTHAQLQSNLASLEGQRIVCADAFIKLLQIIGFVVLPPSIRRFIYAHR